MKTTALITIALSLFTARLHADFSEPFTDSPAGKTVTGKGWLIADTDAKSGFAVIVFTDTGLRALAATIPTNLDVELILGRKVMLTATIQSDRSLLVSNIASSDRTSSIPALSAAERAALIHAANQAVHQYVTKIPEAQRDSLIPEKFWGETITQLKPLRVVFTHMNARIVLRETDGAEEGLYVSNPVASVMDGGFDVFEPLSKPDDKSFGKLYRYRFNKKDEAAHGK